MEGSSRIGVVGHAVRFLLGVILIAFQHVAFGQEEYAQERQDLPLLKGQDHQAPEQSISVLAGKLPFAYYPSQNKMEVAIALTRERLMLAGRQPREVIVRIKDTKTHDTIAKGVVPLDAQFQGQATFSVPDFAEGEYSVEYVIGDHVERSPKTFKRIHFPFEVARFGDTHEVYPPFIPVEVKGPRVSVVERTYTINGFGLFDSVVSKGREILAAPMRLVGETPQGVRMKWRFAADPGGVIWRVVYPDEAVFEAKAWSNEIQLESRVTVQEDGFAKVDWTLLPRAGSGKDRQTTIAKLWLEIPLRDAEVPLFHYIADNGMRFNYAGSVPRGRKIEWYQEPWDRLVPLRWRVARHGQSAVIWTSGDTRQHNNRHRLDHRLFVPYLWLGGEERGLSLLMESERGFVTDDRIPFQRIIRDGEQVILQMQIIQHPVELTSAREITFALMASPGKPLEPTFRSRQIASGIGPCVCWGGWECSSKYPVDHDWSIVDKIQEIRRRGVFTHADEAWFDRKYDEVRQRWSDRRVNGRNEWLWLNQLFARRAAEQGRRGSGVYFEEHATDSLLPEWEVFQDEWASAEFNRFQEKPANWGVFSPSYQDFALYMANEWMRRGVSLYLDSANPKRSYNERFGPAYRAGDGVLRYGITVFGQRTYYRRLYKLRSQWNMRDSEYPIDLTLHITNAQALPFTAWATATLDLEQQAQTEDPAKGPSVSELSQAERQDAASKFTLSEPRTTAAAKQERTISDGFQLPWPPDYTRSVTFGRQGGTIPLALNFLSGHARHGAKDYAPEILLRDWAMRRIHDIRPGNMKPKPGELARKYEDMLLDFGYGRLDEVEHLNYWEEAPPLTVHDDRVKWLALLKKRRARAKGTDVVGLLLLQSYARTDISSIEISFPGAVRFQDVESNAILTAADGSIVMAMPSDFPTRMFYIVGSPTEQGTWNAGQH